MEKTTKVKKIIGQIHQLKTKLKLSEQDYRAILQGCGIESCSEIQVESQANQVLNAFKTLAISSHQANTSFKKKRVGTGFGKLSERQEYYIRGLWNLLMHNSTSDESLDRFVLRVTGVQSLSWISVQQASAVINALRAIAVSKGINPDTRA